MTDTEYIFHLDDGIQKIKNPTEFYFDRETGCFVITYKYGFAYYSFPQSSVRRIVKRDEGKDISIYNGEFIIPVGYFAGDIKARRMDLLKKGAEGE